MVAAAAAGDLVEVGQEPFDHAAMQGWGNERKVHASVLRHLLIAGEWPLDAKGVRLRGVRISGLLDLEGSAVRCPLWLDGCYLDADEPACLDYASASRVSLTRCHLAGLSGKMLNARELDVSGSTFTGPFDLRNADIAGTLDCHGARLAAAARNGNALVADGLKVGGRFDGGFMAAGAVRLLGADITGDFDCDGAQVTAADEHGNALFADALKTGGSVFLRGATAAGAVRLPVAEITCNLECDRALLTAADDDGDALVGDGIRIGGSVFLRDGFTAAGAVRLPVADITGTLDCGGAQLTTANPKGEALFADGLKTGGNVRLHDGFTAAGTVSLASAHVGASCYLMPKALAEDDKVALNAAGAQITGTLQWAPTSAVSGQVNLEGASAAQLDDDWSSGRTNGYWPANGRLRLDGFTYARFGGPKRATAKQRLAWIRSQYETGTADSPPEFCTQPYEQLAAVYQNAGQDTDARNVAITMRADPRKHGSLNAYRRFGNWLLDWSIKYGYQAWRAGVALAIAFVAIWGLAALAQHLHLIVPIGSTERLQTMPSASHCTSDYPCFYPAGYAADTVIPIINVHQADHWGLDGSAPWGWVWVVGAWLATGLGWALATLLVAGYTGLVRQD